MTLRMHHFFDCAHGWLKVDQEAQEALGLTSSSLSQHSYVYNDTLWAEEDCDMAIVMVAHHRKFGTLPDLESHELSPDILIRNFPSCTGRDIDWKSAYAYLDQVKQDGSPSTQ